MIKLRIESKLLIFCITLSLIVYAFMLKKYDNEINNNEKIRIGSFKEHSDWLAKSIADQFFERYEDTKIIGHSLALRWQSLANIQDTLNAYVSLYQVYDVILFVDLEGNYVASNNLDQFGKQLNINILRKQNFFNEPWFRGIKEINHKRVYVRDVALDKISTQVYGQQRYGAAFTTLVFDNKTKEPLGILTARSNLKWIQDTFIAIGDSLAINNFKTLELMLVDKNGVELIGYQPGLKEAKLKSTEGFELLSGFNLEKAGFEPGRKLYLGESGAMIARDVRSNRDQVVGFTKIDTPKFDKSLGWGVLVAASAGDVLGYAYETRFVLRIVGLALISLLVISGIALTKYLSGRRALALQAERVRSIVDHVADGIITINAQCQIKNWNLAAKKIFGYEKDEVLEKNVKILVPEPYRSQHDALVTDYFKTGKAKIIGVEREVIGRRKDGSSFPMDLAVSEFKIGDQRFFTGVVRDITERKKIAEDLQAAKEAAEAANLAKSAFLANMSHEIRTPLGAILGFSELIINPEVSAAEKESFVVAIKRNGDLLSNIIDDILDLSRVEAGKLKIDYRESNVSEILSDVISILKPRAIESGLALMGSCDSNVPQIIMSDPFRIKQVLLNIVGNAIKFTECGSVVVTAKFLSPEGKSPKLVFVVKDTGVGISKKQAENLFQFFSQADPSTKRKFGGAGLGLALSKRLANLLGGEIVLTESTPGKGSTFTITLDPGRIPTVQTVRDEEKLTRGYSTTYKELRLDGIKILLAEDSIDNQMVFSRLLKLAGASVDTADNGRIALEKARSENYDVILMDIQMPIMDGYEATTQLRKQGYKKPILALTAHARKEDREHCLASGFNDHISKPIDFSSFIETIAGYKKGADSREELSSATLI